MIVVNLTDVKDFIVDHKKYLLLLFLVLALGLLFWQHDQEMRQPDNLVRHEDISGSANKEVSSKQTEAASKQTAATVTIDIAGAVNEQGVYTLRNGARIQQAIEAAGGLRKNAQLKAINRAVVLKDQDKIYIPYRGEKNTAAVATAGSGTADPTSADPNAASEQTKINLNTATAADLQKLNGIGEKKAAQIIAYREKEGSFKKIADIMQVSGIGSKTFAALKDQLAV